MFGIVRNRGTLRASLVAALVLLTASAAHAQTDGSERISSGIDAAAMRYSNDVNWLADDARQGRGLGTEGLADAGRWLEQQFRDIGLEPAGDDGGYRNVFGVPIADPSNPHAQKGFLYAFNVVGRIRGNGQLDGVVVIGAHYDHLGYGQEGSLDPDSREIHNGADDNASGTAALLEAARQLAERRDQLDRDVVFIAFSAEEAGLVGASNFVRQPPDGLTMDDVVAMLNIDMVGRLRDDRLSVLGGDSAEEWDDLVGPLCDRSGIECAIGGDGFGSSDQSAFFAADIPVLHFFTGTHPDYHKPSDDANLINAQGGARVAWLVSDVAGTIANREGELTLVKTSDGPQPRMALKARLGTIPDYAGPADGSPGLLLSDVRPDSPAEAAGLRRGDLIVRIGDMDIASVQDYMVVLSEANPGDTAPVVVLRDGERIELEVTFGAPR
ncbi:MAG: M20/M25/M40 family metallo-hydrolase [Candidatus Palauibacterales bacterium]|nr:M20/M25/M40 family metallo-hydrolase [Candidatus Palauibacterales bacterium]